MGDSGRQRIRSIKARVRLHWEPIEDGNSFSISGGVFRQTQQPFKPRNGSLTPELSGIPDQPRRAGIHFRCALHPAPCRQKMFVSLGWTDPESFMDENRFAGNGRIQFVNSMFNNEPIFDGIDTNLPIVAVGFNPDEQFKFTMLAQASTYAGRPGDQRKGDFEDIADSRLSEDS